MQTWRFYPRYEPRGVADPTPEEKLLQGVFRNAYRAPVLNKLDGVTLREAIDHVLADLTERERRVIRARFGFDRPEGKGETLAAIGKLFCVQKERIRQIEGKALRKLRWPGRSRQLKPYCKLNVKGGAEHERMET